MGNRFASGKRAISECDRCGFRFPLKELRSLVVKTKNINVLVCRSCWDPDHPQLLLGMYPVEDPQAVRNPRPDRSYFVSGLLADGSNAEGSRIIQWGWNPVGLDNALNLPDIENYLLAIGQVGTVAVITS
jgi:hypothetical protein